MFSLFNQLQFVRFPDPETGHIELTSTPTDLNISNYNKFWREGDFSVTLKD